MEWINYSSDPEAVEIRGSRSEKLSKASADNLINGKVGFIVGKFYSEKNKKDFTYRSSYEKKAFEILEEDNNVISYRYEPFRLPYEDINGINRMYVPDFLIYYCNGEVELIEVKPQCLVEYNKFKHEAAQHFCEEFGYKFVIWSERQLDIG